MFTQTPVHGCSEQSYAKCPKLETQTSANGEWLATWGTSTMEHCSAANKQEQSTDTKPFGCISW